MPYKMRIIGVNGQYNNNQLIHDRNLTSNRLKNLTSVLIELIYIRDGYKECNGLMLSYWIFAQINYLCFTALNIVINTCTILILHNCITMCE